MMSSLRDYLTVSGYTLKIMKTCTAYLRSVYRRVRNRILVDDTLVRVVQEWQHTGDQSMPVVPSALRSNAYEILSL
jgi:hypothetical protein